MFLPGIYAEKVPKDPQERECFELQLRKKKAEDKDFARKCQYIFNLSLMLAPVSDGRMLSGALMNGVPDFKIVDARDEGRLCAHTHFRSIMLGWDNLSSIEVIDLQRIHEYAEYRCPIQTELRGTEGRTVYRREQALKYAEEKVKPWFVSAKDQALMKRWMDKLARCTVDGLIDCPFPKQDMELRFYKEHIGYAMDALELLILA